MNQKLFKDFLFNEFEKWEKTQLKRRSSISAFARWLSDNSFNIEIKQQIINTWMNGVIPKDYKYINVLAEKLGDEIYDILVLPRPNPYLQKINRLWDYLPEEIQKRISEETEKYETENISKRVHRISKQRETRQAE